MIIFSTAGGGAGGVIAGHGLLSDAYPSATTFRHNGYIHRLNRTLQAEMRAIAAYRAYDSNDRELVADGAEHQAAARELVRLIIANRGVPEDRSALDLGLTPALIRIFGRVPTRFFARATVGTLETIERRLVGQYRRLLSEAPQSDAAAIAELLRQTERHAEHLAVLKRG